MTRAQFAILTGVVVAAAAVMNPGAHAEGAIDHAPWDRLVKQFVADGKVDYENLKARRAEVDQYAASLATADAESLPSKEAKLAFWINAYNAAVIQSVLDRYPIKLVRDVKGFFDGIRHRIAGESLTLNEIEAKGRALRDWRIHFAVVCASHSCPPLRSEAYVPERLNEQLDDQVRAFLANRESGLRVDDRILWVSKIFKWYEADFLPTQPNGKRPKLSTESLAPLISPFVDAQLLQQIRSQPLALKLLDYDWSLNSQTP